MFERRTLLKHACLAALLSALAGCERSAPTGAAQAAAQSAPATQPAVALRDWPAEPDIDPSELSARPLRIVSGAPNVTEICAALGLSDWLVGRTDFCDHPPQVRQVASIGALTQTNLELLLELRPELVIIAGHSQMLSNRLTPLKVRLESIPDATLDDLFAAIRLIGGWTGRPRTAARLCEHITRELERVAERIQSPPRRVLVVIGTLDTPPTPPFVAGPGSFYDDLLRRLGHTNAAPASLGRFAPLSLEATLAADPDVILELDGDQRHRPDGDADAVRAWSALGALRAVKERRVHVIPGRRTMILGPRVAETLLRMGADIRGPAHE